MIDGVVACRVKSRAHLKAGGPAVRPAAILAPRKRNLDHYFPRYLPLRRSRTVTIAGDGNTDLDLCIFDVNGKLVARAIDLTDGEAITFLPSLTSTYRGPQSVVLLWPHSRPVASM